ncbi:hypothetical protein ABBQ32_001530 [Trebouxia sp. C0010 RCD-2024]
MESLRQLRVSSQLTQTIQDLHDETTLRLHNALQVSCADFRPEPYSKVLQGFIFLGHVEELGGEVASAFTNAVNATVVQGMLLTRPGFEERVKGSSNMQEMLKWLPSDLFRTSLARVFMAVFDIMVSHYNMTRWHEAGLTHHKTDLAALQAAKLACKQRLLMQSPQQPASTNEGDCQDPPGVGRPPVGSAAVITQLVAVEQPKDDPRAVPRPAVVGTGLSGSLAMHPMPPPDSDAPSASYQGRLLASPAAASQPATQLQQAGRAFAASPQQQQQQQQQRQAKMTVRFDSQVPAISPQTVAAATPQHPHPHGYHPAHRSAHDAGEGVGAGQQSAKKNEQQQWREELEAGSAERAEAQGLQRQEREEVEWGEVLHVVLSGLVASRRLLWDESERKIIALLSSSSAFEGDHFLQVLDWAQRILAAGEAFSGVECVSLRSMLTAQSSNFFTAYHSANLEALHSMLEKELWRRLPPLPEGVPSLQHALRNPRQTGSLSSSHPREEGAKPFEIFAARGNPWKQRRRRSPKGVLPASPSGPFRLGFAGSSVLQEDRASRRLEVDEHGLPCQEATDIWSAATSRGASCAVSTTTSRAASRRTSRDADVAGSAGGLLSESEASELFGEYIDEDSQTVQHDVDGSSSANVTNSSHKLMRWLRDYGELMRILRPAPFAYRGMCELFEMFLLMTFNTFSEVSLTDLLNEQLPQGYTGNALANRLRKTLMRIVNQSLVQYKAAVVATRLPHAPGSQQGNMWGLLERTVAVECLGTVAGELKKSKADLQGLLPASEYSALETFFSRTVEAAEDVYDAILRAGARLNLPILPLSERIAGHKWDLPSPPPKASPWVDEMCMHVQMFRERLCQVKSLSDHNLLQLWRHAIHYVAEVILEGVARVRGRCSTIGRNAMSADVAEVFKGVRALAPNSPDIAVAADSNQHLVDNYVKAFFVTSPTDLQHWVATHPEYSREHLILLATAIADFKGLKKKDRQTLLELIEGSIM